MDPPEELVESVVDGRGAHSSSFQLNMSCFVTEITPLVQFSAHRQHFLWSVWGDLVTRRLKLS